MAGIKKGSIFALAFEKEHSHNGWRLGKQKERVLWIKLIQTAKHKEEGGYEKS